jgi:hypothetical protein
MSVRFVPFRKEVKGRMDDMTVHVLSKTQTIVIRENQPVQIVKAGPIGPPGLPGPPGAPGEDANTSVATVMNSHVISSTPHPAYDDIPDLTLLLENGLL